MYWVKVSFRLHKETHEQPQLFSGVTVQTLLTCFHFHSKKRIRFVPEILRTDITSDQSRYMEKYSLSSLKRSWELLLTWFIVSADSSVANFPFYHTLNTVLGLDLQASEATEVHWCSILLEVSMIGLYFVAIKGEVLPLKAKDTSLEGQVVSPKPGVFREQSNKCARIYHLYGPAFAVHVWLHKHSEKLSKQRTSQRSLNIRPTLARFGEEDQGCGSQAMTVSINDPKVSNRTSSKCYSHTAGWH